jgi:hypothetical protein
MGRKLLPGAALHVPDASGRVRRRGGPPEADLHMLATIRFRGEQPRTKERWRYIYAAISTSKAIDAASPSHRPGRGRQEP